MSILTQKDFETVIGLEVHLQFSTRTKIFCGCESAFGREPNTCVCPVCLGLPGTLPVLNKSALDSAIKTALALNCTVNSYIKFDRKNYYYPDLPKGYQISQFDFPIGHDGYLDILVNGNPKRIRIHRAHIEEDAGKLIHDNAEGCSLVDYNRTGTPLMEIVTEPDLRSPQEAYDYLTALKLALQYLDVSDCDMEKGSLRCDANISLRRAGETRLGTKTELKNMNSFKAVKAALEFEEMRQFRVLATGGTIVQETRLWNEDKQATFTMRTKEEAHDYRYFPEPDLVPFIVEDAEIERIRLTLPENPQAKCQRLQKDYGLSDYDATIIVQDRHLADFFEHCAKHSGKIKKIANWIIGPLLKELKDRRCSVKDLSLKPEQFVLLVEKVENGDLSNLAGKDILITLLEDGSKTVEDLIERSGLSQVSDDALLESIADETLKEHADVVTQIKNGNHGAVGFLIGQAMKKSQGKGNPKKIKDIIQRRLFNA